VENVIEDGVHSVFIFGLSVYRKNYVTFVKINSKACARKKTAKTYEKCGLTGHWDIPAGTGRTGLRRENFRPGIRTSRSGQDGRRGIRTAAEWT